MIITGWKVTNWKDKIMDIKIIIGVIIFIILISFQYTLNCMLKELREIKELIRRNSKKI
jgi:hypothetical protein